MSSLKQNDTWTLTYENPKFRTLQGRWVYKLKRDENGTPIRYKARQVVKGYKQEYGTDYTQIFASVTKTPAYKTVISYATQFNLEIEQMDVITAFLQGDLNEELYVEQLYGFSTNDQVCKLQKALYGLKQVLCCWQTKLKSVLGQARLYPLH